MATKNLVLRTMYIDPDVDDQLRTEAFDNRTSKNDLLRKYLRLGMEAARHGASLDSAAQKGVARKTVAKKAVLAPAPAARTPQASKPAEKSPLRAVGRAKADATTGRGKVPAKQVVSG